MASNTVRIQNAILARVAATSFPKLVTQDDGTYVLAADIVPAPTELTVSPESVSCNETDSEFSDAVRNRRTFRDDRTNQSWELRLKFKCPVSLETFEETWVAAPIMLPGDKTAGVRQVSLHLRNSQVSHPPAQGPKTGTAVTYSVLARHWPS